MSEQTDNLANLLTPFGLNEDEARIYLVLLAKGVLSALQIARELKLGRTKVYRILDKLIAKEMVVQSFNEAGFKFTASEPSKLELLIATKAGEVAALEQALPYVRQVLERQQGSDRPGSKVFYYRGSRGLSQVNWNLLQAKGIFRSFEVGTADVYLPIKEAEKLRQELVRNKIKTKTITNQNHYRPFTQVTEMVRDWWEIRWIDPEVFKIKADVFIYNQVYTLCHYLKSGDIFCLEMHNQDLAEMQRQMFEIVWAQAKPMKKVGVEGEVILE